MGKTLFENSGTAII